MARPTLPFACLTALCLVACAPSDQADDPGRAAVDESRAALLALDGVGELAYPVPTAEVTARFGVPFPDLPEYPEAEWCEMTWLPLTPGDSILAMFTQQGLVRMDVRQGTRRTGRGVGIGSGEDEVRAAYGEGVEVTPHRYTDGSYLTVREPSGSRALVFETDGRVVTMFRVGALPQVAWVEGCS
ncbi:MAG TPA: hypothetical protein VK858_21995 [Longimicrobiales bacterium]|nr:hypothetical protein [Longimicrobiales bacterium]